MTSINIFNKRGCSLFTAELEFGSSFCCHRNHFMLQVAADFSRNKKLLKPIELQITGGEYVCHDLGKSLYCC